MGAAFRTLAREASGTAGESRFLPPVGMIPKRTSLMSAHCLFAGSAIRRTRSFAPLDSRGGCPYTNQEAC